MQKMTTEEAVKFLRGCGPTCSPRELSKAIGGQPYSYNVAAKRGKLVFDYMWRGNALRIYTESVITAITGGNVNVQH